MVSPSHMATRSRTQIEGEGRRSLASIAVFVLSRRRMREFRCRNQAGRRSVHGIWRRAGCAKTGDLERGIAAACPGYDFAGRNPDAHGNRGGPCCAGFVPCRSLSQRVPREAVARTQLPPDLSPPQLVQFLGVADRDMQDIWIRLPSVQGGREELIRIAKLKLEASRRLKNHAEADPGSQVCGCTGRAPSPFPFGVLQRPEVGTGTGGIGDCEPGSSDPDLVADSRLVLIGFALESLQNGEAGAADRVIGYIDQIAASASSRDVPTLMVMGQARDAFAGYGHEEHANRVRNTIIELYADSPNPDLAMAAAELAGSVLYDDLELLLSEALNGQTVTVDQWRAATDQLISQSANLRTVEYLAGAALQLEAIGQDNLVQTTFDALVSGFDDPDSAAGREVRIAMAAKDARHDILGIRFNPVLPERGRFTPYPWTSSRDVLSLSRFGPPASRNHFG